MRQPLVRWALFMASLCVSCGRTELWPSGRPRGELTLAWDDEQGVSHRTRALEAAPARVEFGDVASGGRATRVVRAENTGPGPLVFERVVAMPGSADAFLATWTTETLAPGASQQVALSFAPLHADVREQARFRFIASYVEPGGESIDLLARGQSPAMEAAVPDLAVTPFPRVDLGRVTWAAGAMPALRSELRLSNAGRGSLRLTAPWSVAGVRGAADELCVGVLELPSGTCRSAPPPEYDPARGLLANEAMQVSLWLSPRTLGLKSWTLTLFSNDPDEPEKVVEVVAEVMPECVATVTPSALDFGVLGTTPRELTVEVHNRSQTAGAVCHLSGLRLGAGSDPVFSLVGAPPNATIDPGQSLRLVVRAWSRSAPPTRRQVTGFVELEFANAPTPRHTVSLAATLGRSCLTLSPAELDFGSLRAGCASGARRVTLINSCPGPLTVHGVDLVAATSITPEYQLTQRPALPLRLPASATATVELEYRPADLGEDRAALRVRAEFNQETFDELSMLTGRGAAGPENVDTFRQGVPRADVLLVIDDSGSMTDKQRALAANLDSFLNELRPNRVDFRIGVVTTTMALDGGAALVRSSSGQTYLESGTPCSSRSFVSWSRSGPAVMRSSRAFTLPSTCSRVRTSSFATALRCRSSVCPMRQTRRRCRPSTTGASSSARSPLSPTTWSARFFRRHLRGASTTPTPRPSLRAVTKRWCAAAAVSSERSARRTGAERSRRWAAPSQGSGRASSSRPSRRSRTAGAFRCWSTPRRCHRWTRVAPWCGRIRQRRTRSISPSSTSRHTARWSRFATRCRVGCE